MIYHFVRCRFIRFSRIIIFIVIFHCSIVLLHMIVCSHRLLLSSLHHQILIASATATFLPSNALSSSSYFVTGDTTMEKLLSTVTNEVSCTKRTDDTCSENSNKLQFDDVTKFIHPIGLGTYLMKREEIPIVLRNAIEIAGYRRIDCAPVYFNEDIIGDTIHSIIHHDKIISRGELFMVSKLPSPFHHNPELAIRKILNDLRLDYLDLFLSKLILASFK
jgi:hypothetical protein